MLSIIVPTLGKRLIELKQLFISLEEQSIKSFEVICIVQSERNILNEINELLNSFTFECKVIFTEKRGLSRARNLGLKNIRIDSRLTTFSDDDCWYPKDMVERVLTLSFKYPNDCFCFQIFDPDVNQYYKEYFNKMIEKMNKRQTLKVSSIEFFIPSRFLNGLSFDENFGLGTKYPSGEENIFLFDIIKKGINIIYIPNIITFHKKPSWQDKEYIFTGKGALFTRLYNKPAALFMIIIYSIRKFKYFKSFWKQFTNMLIETFTIKK